MFPIIALSLLAVVALFIILVVTRPSTFRVSRSVLIAAPAARIFDQVEDFRAWSAWSPWEGIDPTMTRTHGGPAAGIGASYRWAGNRNVGEGAMTITDARPGEHLGLAIEFIKPFAAKNRITFDFVTNGNGTTVTWTMSGTSSFMFKAMGLFINCDKMIGDQYEKGLAQLKIISEAGARQST